MLSTLHKIMYTIEEYDIVSQGATLSSVSEVSPRLGDSDVQINFPIQIKKAYMRAIRILHPDKFTGTAQQILNM